MRVILEASEIKGHIRRCQETKFETAIKSFGTKKRELMSSLFSNCEEIDVSCFYENESHTLNTVNVL